MANRVQKLPGAAKRYFVEEPLMMVSIGEFQQLTEHMTRMTALHQYSEKEANAIKQRHQLYLKKARTMLKEAKDYYHIKN